MASWTNHKAEIYEYGTGSFAGPLVGTITNLLQNGAEGTNNLDEAGSGWLKLHGADTPSLALCREFRLVRVLATSSVTGMDHEICCFIIRDIVPEIRGRHVIYTVSGPDLTGSIKWGNIGFGVISDNAGGPSPTPILDCLLLTDKAWAVVRHGTAPNDAVFVGSGETAYVVLTNLLLQQNGHFSFALANNPVFALHVWYSFTQSCGITLRESDTPEIYQDNPYIAVITKPIKVIKEAQEMFTRAWVYGAGMGVDRWTFKEFNLGPIMMYGWGFNNYTSLIINMELESQIPVIATTKSFPALEPSDPEDELAVQTNARAIFYAGLNWLRSRAQSEITYYEIPDLVIHGDLIPGQRIHVIYNRSSRIDASGALNTTDILNLDHDLIILSIKHRLGADGVRFTSLLVGENPKPLSNGLDIMANRLKDLEETVRHTNAGSGSSGTSGGETSYLWSNGSGPILTGDLLVDPLVTIDGVDISAHAEDADAHHVPGTLSVHSINYNDGVETHAVDASSDPGQQTYLLKTDVSGQLILFRVALDHLVLTDRTTTDKYDLFVNDGKLFMEPLP